jgi:hypothetical protein
MERLYDHAAVALTCLRELVLGRMQQAFLSWLLPLLDPLAYDCGFGDPTV